MHDATHEILNALKVRGYRVTKPRKELVGILSLSSSPLTLPEILKQTSVDEVTVYRNLELLQREQLLEVLTLNPGQKQFALSHAHHHHVVCTHCGIIEHIPCPTAGPTVPKTEHFKVITDHEVTYYGICTDCA